MAAHLNLIEETIAREKLSWRKLYTNFTLFLMVTFFVFRNLMSRCDNQYFSSVRMSAARANTFDGFNIRKPQDNKITTTDSLYQQSSMTSSFVFMLMSFGLKAYSRPVRLERPNRWGKKKKKKKADM